MTAQAVGDYLAAQQRLESKLPAPDLPWLVELRDGGVERLRDAGFPSLRDEDWRYTNVQSLLKKPFEMEPIGPCDVDAAFVARTAIPSLECYRVVVVNGIPIPHLSDVTLVPDGLRVSSLADLLVSDPSRLEPYLGKNLVPDPHGFTAMNSAFLGNGLVVEIAPGQVFDKPLEIVFVASAATESTMAQPRNLVVAGKGSQLQVLVRYVAIGAQRTLTNVVTEVIVDADAHLTLYQLQEESKNSFHIGGLFAKLGRGSRFDAFAITLAGELVRNDVRVDLDGAGAEVNLRGLYLARGRQHIDNHTQIFHNEPGCISHEHYKGVLDDRARAVFHGRIVVQPDAQKTVSEQSNQNLLLSRDAEIDTKPQLEIYADDVKCAHGATVGQLDKDALFYLRSRGIAEEAAKRLLIKAFASDVLLAVSPDSLREHLLTRVEMMLTD